MRKWAARIRRQITRPISRRPVSLSGDLASSSPPASAPGRDADSGSRGRTPRARPLPWPPPQPHRAGGSCPPSHAAGRRSPPPAKKLRGAVGRGARGRDAGRLSTARPSQLETESAKCLSAAASAIWASGEETFLGRAVALIHLPLVKRIERPAEHSHGMADLGRHWAQLGGRLVATFRCAGWYQKSHNNCTRYQRFVESGFQIIG